VTKFHPNELGITICCVEFGISNEDLVLQQFSLKFLWQNFVRFFSRWFARIILKFYDCRWHCHFSTISNFISCWGNIGCLMDLMKLFYLFNRKYLVFTVRKFVSNFKWKTFFSSLLISNYYKRNSIHFRIIFFSVGLKYVSLEIKVETSWSMRDRCAKM